MSFRTYIIKSENYKNFESLVNSECLKLEDRNCKVNDVKYQVLSRETGLEFYAFINYQI